MVNLTARFPESFYNFIVEQVRLSEAGDSCEGGGHEHPVIAYLDGTPRAAAGH